MLIIIVIIIVLNGFSILKPFLEEKGFVGFCFQLLIRWKKNMMNYEWLQIVGRCLYLDFDIIQSTVLIHLIARHHLIARINLLIGVLFLI